MEDINAQNTSGWTLLHQETSENGHVTIKSLLEQKANPHIYTKGGNSPLMLCTYNEARECFRLLLKHETPITLMHKNKAKFTVLDSILTLGLHDFAAWVVDAGGGHALNFTKFPPLWFTELLEQRKNIKRTLIVFHYLGRKNPYLKKDMTDKIAKMIWETRDQDEWLNPHEEEYSPKKMKI